MNHNYIDIDQDNIATQVLFQHENNLDAKDNLDELPALPAVYAVCGRVNGKPANPRYIGETENLRAAIRKHFDKSETELDGCLLCFKEFMLSIKIKELIYSVMPDSSPEERLLVKQEWQERYRPDCNKEINETF